MNDVSNHILCVSGCCPSLDQHVNLNTVDINIWGAFQNFISGMLFWHSQQMIQRYKQTRKNHLIFDTTLM